MYLVSLSSLNGVGTIRASEVECFLAECKPLLLSKREQDWRAKHNSIISLTLLPVGILWKNPTSVGEK